MPLDEVVKLNETANLEKKKAETHMSRFSVRDKKLKKETENLVQNFNQKMKEYAEILYSKQRQKLYEEEKRIEHQEQLEKMRLEGRTKA